jgi:hypothetical protein
LVVEGGGDSKDLKTRCREAFSKLLREAGLEGRMPRIVAGGSRGRARKKFEGLLASGEKHVLLLVDSEAPVDSPNEGRPWAHLKARDQWQKPAGASDEQCHLMVQCMESWFLADPEAVASYFGQGFKGGDLPKKEDRAIEQVPKEKVFQSLDRAAKGTKKKGYRKGAHAFSLLATIDPKKIENDSPWAKRFFDRMRELAKG